MNSLLKHKTGICLDCTDGKEKPIVSGRCQHHYWKYREEQSEFKRQKRAEMNAFLGKSDPVKKKPKPIPKMSKKREKESREYTIKRLQFLSKPENMRCPITGERATEIHHKAGRTGSNFLDTSTWLAVSRNGHLKIEQNPEWAKENGYSVNRI